MSRPVDGPNGRVGQWPSQTLLGMLSPQDQTDLIALGDVRRYDAGAVLIREGDQGADVSLLLSGYLKVFGTSIDGQSVLLAVRIGGDVVGELSALDLRPRSATVVAATDVTTKFIAHRLLLDFLEPRPQVLRALHRCVVDKLRRATQHRIDIAGVRLLVRLARMLDHLAETYGEHSDEGLAIGVPLSQTDLASLVGATEPSVHRVLTLLRNQRILSTGYRRVLIHNRSALRAIADAAVR